MNDEVNLSEQEIIVAKTLLTFCIQNKGRMLVTYGRLVELANEKGAKCHERSLRHNLDKINRWCKNYQNAHMITALVINQDIGRPNNGFRDLRREFNSRTTSDEIRSFLIEWKAVRDYNEWGRVLKNLKALAEEKGINWDEI